MDAAGNRSLDGLLDSLGERVRRRPSPRLGVTIAAAGAFLATAGVVVVSGDAAVDRSGHFNRAPGLIFCGAAVAVGYLLVARASTGPLTAAGVGVSVLAIPLALGFATVSSRTSTVNVNAVAIVSIVAYVASYFVGPGRGHTFYAAAAVIMVWLFLLQQVDDVGRLTGSFFTICFEGECEKTDTSGWGVMSLAIGVGYLIASRYLDRRDRVALGTPFMFGGLVALSLGLTLLGNEAGAAPTGVGIAVAGLVVAYFGATSERRGTTWYGGVGIVVGLGLLIGDVFNDSAVGAGFAAVAAGIGLVVLGSLVAMRWREPDELTPGPSRFVVNPAPPSNTPPFAPTPPPTPPSAPPRRRDEPLRPPGR